MRLAAELGERVRAARLSHGWTLDRLAAEAGLSRRMLVSVEQGAVNSSLATLLRLSDALGIGLPALVERVRDRPMSITRAGEGAILWRSPGGGRGALVAGFDRPDVVELWEWTLAPGDSHESDAHIPGTRELLQVREGVLTLDAADRTVTLHPGDATAFPGDHPHAYRNRGEHHTSFTLSVFEPGSRGRVPSAGGHVTEETPHA
ncbi:helix-turn-helix domain-containing protein [Microbacterium marinilacus]|nr:XRE family transcriptional regulator [Microbacterium marinilacus]MBY0687930.1 XRE family transcriptional regulator [Microbacterium marinilacus]